MIKPNSRQCEIARFITGSYVKDEQIIKELNCTAKEEWNEMFKSLDDLLKKHDSPLTHFEDGYVLTAAREFVSVSDDFVTVSAPEGVDAATLFIVYMNWQSE